MSTPAAGPWTKYAQQQGPWSKYAQPATTSGLTPEALAANKARNAEPTQFEKDRAGDTAVSNAISQITHPLAPNPNATASSPWFEQANGQQAGEPFSLNRLLDSPAGNAAHEANVNAAKFGADTLGGAEIARPFAALAESHVLPALKSLPYAGKVISTIDEAPGILGKVTRGAAVGGAAGGTEGLIRGHGLSGSAEDAMKGAGYGAAGGLILPGIHKLAGVEPTVPERPFYGPEAPSEIQMRRSARIGSAQPEQPATGIGAHLPAAEEFYENRGNELNKIRTMNETNDRRVARDAKANAPEPSPIVQPNATTPPSEGRPATWTNERVQELSSGGNPRTFQAANQAQLRQLDVPNVGLVADPQAVTTPSVGRPRSVTRFDASGSPVETGRIASPISLGEGEDLGPGFGTQHTIQKNGNRIGSVQVEPKGEGNLHVHWLGGDLADNGVTRTHVINSLKEQYPGTENITYDRRRLAKGDSAATTEPRTMKISGPSGE
jgi:hypothetical protein